MEDQHELTVSYCTDKISRIYAFFFLILSFLFFFLILFLLTTFYFFTSPWYRFGLILMREQYAGLSFLWKREESHSEQELAKAIGQPGTLFSRLHVPPSLQKTRLGLFPPFPGIVLLSVWMITAKAGFLTTPQCTPHPPTPKITVCSCDQFSECTS